MNSNHNSYSSSSSRNLIVNYLPHLLSDRDLNVLFSAFGPLEHVRVMRDRITGYSHGYGFVKFYRAEDAVRAVEHLNGLILQDKRLKVSYARPHSDDRKDTNLYITNLPHNLTASGLVALFGVYGPIIQHNLLKDKLTGKPRGVAFVRYERKSDAEAAIADLQGKIMKGCEEPINIKVAKEHTRGQAFYYAAFQWGLAKQRAMPANDLGRRFAFRYNTPTNSASSSVA